MWKIQKRNKEKLVTMKLSDGYCMHVYMSFYYFIKPVCSAEVLEQFYCYPLAMTVTHGGKQLCRYVCMEIIKKLMHFYFKLQTIMFTPSCLLF